MTAISDAGQQYERFQEAKRSGMSPYDAYMKTSGTIPFGAGSLDSVPTMDGIREETNPPELTMPDVDTMKRVEGKVIASRPLFARAREAFAKLLKL